MKRHPHVALVARRCVTIPSFILLWVGVSLALLPVSVLTLLLGATSPRRSRHWVATRLWLFFWMYLSAEVIGIGVLTLARVGSLLNRDRTMLLNRTFRIQQVWCRVLFGALRLLFSLSLKVEGLAGIGKGPVLVLLPHASIVDVLLPSVLLSGPLGLRLRYILKKELLLDPCLDIAGHWLPNYFVSRDGKDSEQEMAGIAHLARDLRSGDGVLIFPEGTRFTEEKRDRALSRLAQTAPSLHLKARTLRHVLPPRIGGALTLLDAASADVVICAHRGLHGLARISDIWRQGLVGRTLHIRCWRIPRSSIPESREDRIQWLYQVWQSIDDWITQLDAQTFHSGEAAS